MPTNVCDPKVAKHPSRSGRRQALLIIRQSLDMKFRSILSIALFTLVALLGYAVWAFGSSLFSSEPAMYAGCALAFLGLGGPALLPDSGDTGGRHIRFCLSFSLAFLVYAFFWSVSWFSLPTTFGEIIGSSIGLAGFALVYRGIMGYRVPITTATATLFLWHSVGYYAGDFLYAAIQGRGPAAMSLDWEPTRIRHTARLSWGLCYGVGLGLGINRFLHLSRQS